VCKSFDEFAIHVSNHFEDVNAEPPFDMRIWRDPWPNTDAGLGDDSEDDDDEDDDNEDDDNEDDDNEDDDNEDDSSQEDDQDDSGNSQDFEGGGGEGIDDQESGQPGGSAPDSFNYGPFFNGLDGPFGNFAQGFSYQSSQEHKGYRILAKDQVQRSDEMADSTKELSICLRDEPWSALAMQTLNKLTFGATFQGGGFQVESPAADGRKYPFSQGFQNQFNLLTIPRHPTRQCVYFIDALNNTHELHLSACEKTEVG
jgi:hypothetical protein